MERYLKAPSTSESLPLSLESCSRGVAYYAKSVEAKCSG